MPEPVSATPSPTLSLPSDSILLPLAHGKLLLSRGHAIFCRVSEHHVASVEAVLRGEATPDGLAPELRDKLTQHGFGGPPREGKPPTPSVQLQLTNACNLACAYCCTNSGAPRQGEIDRDTAFAIIDDAIAIMGKGTRIAILGGEPLLVTWAIELADYVVGHGLDLTLFTNGIPLADESIARRVGEVAGRGAHVRVSLAGASPETCDNTSGAPRFERVIEGIHNLARFGPLPAVDLMLLPSQIDDVAEHLTALRKLLPAGIAIALGIPYLSGREQGRHLFTSRAVLEDALDRIAFEAGETIAAAPTSPLAERREGCSCALGHHLHVRSDGSLFTCFKMEEKVGDLRSMRFSEGLESLRANARPSHTLPMCAECPLASLCGGGCRSENLQYTGDADVPVCGPWRVRVVAELLAEDRVTALEWPAPHLLAEARARGIDGPDALIPVIKSRHLIEV